MIYDNELTLDQSGKLGRIYLPFHFFKIILLMSTVFNKTQNST